MAGLFEVTAGSRWMSNDKRDSLAKRRANAFEVVGFEMRKRIEYARVKPLFSEGHGHRSRLIAIHRFKPNATGYVPFASEPEKRGAK